MTIEVRKRILFLCTHDSSRSQMAERLLRKRAGDRFDVHSAGTEVTRVHSLAVEAMREIGIDISVQRSKNIDDFTGQHFDYVITVCDQANESYPMLPGATERVHWSFEDPAKAAGTADQQLQTFRRVREAILARLRLFGTVTGRR